MIADIRLRFWYDDVQFIPPEEWNWGAILANLAKGVQIIESSSYRGFPCYFCNDPIPEDDIVWINIENGESEGPPDGEPFHMNCAPSP